MKNLKRIFFAFAMVAATSGCTDCGADATGLPEFPAVFPAGQALLKAQAGGFKGWLAVHCNDPIDWSTVTQQDVQDKIDGKKAFLRLSCELLQGSKPKSSTSEQQWGCVKSFYGRSHTATFTDRGTDSIQSQDTLYTYFQANPNAFIFYPITCDGLLYDWGNVSLNPSKEIQEAGDSNTNHWILDMSWQSDTDSIGFIVPFIDALTPS